MTAIITLDGVSLSVEFEYQPYQRGNPPVEEELEISKALMPLRGWNGSSYLSYADVTGLIDALDAWDKVRAAVMAEISQGVGV